IVQPSLYSYHRQPNLARRGTGSSTTLLAPTSIARAPDTPHTPAGFLSESVPHPSAAPQSSPIPARPEPSPTTIPAPPASPNIPACCRYTLDAGPTRTARHRQLSAQLPLAPSPPCSYSP